MSRRTWKKDFEDDHASYLKTLLSGSPIDILIVDRSTKRMFLAKALRWQTGGANAIDLGRVPQYYRDHAGEIFGWFLLNNISEVDFDEETAINFGDHTLIRLDASADGQAEKVAVTASAFNKSCILHLSDLHFGADYAFLTQNEITEIGDPRKTLTECLLTDL